MSTHASAWLSMSRAASAPLASSRCSASSSAFMARHDTYARTTDRSSFASDPALAAGGEDRDRAHRSGQALAERLGRKLQRQVSRRVSEPGVVQESDRCEDRDRRLAASLQRGSTPFEPRLPDAAPVQAARFNNQPQGRRSLESLVRRKPAGHRPSQVIHRRSAQTKGFGGYVGGHSRLSNRASSGHSAACVHFSIPPLATIPADRSLAPN